MVRYGTCTDNACVNMCIQKSRGGCGIEITVKPLIIKAHYLFFH